MKFKQLPELLNKTFNTIKKQGDEIHFYIGDILYYRLMQERFCCEYAFIENIIGDLSILENDVILSSELSISENLTTCTFTTQKGEVEIVFNITDNFCLGSNISLNIILFDQIKFEIEKEESKYRIVEKEEHIPKKISGIQM